jgi:sugar-specific transcriptional regulator TrmB
MRDWKSLLKKLGFTEGEAMVYIAALEMGSATVQDIAKKAKVSRVTTYAAIERLVHQGLITTVMKGKRVLYHAEPPKRLIEVVSRHVASIESTLADIKDSVDELSLLQGGEKPAVKVFEGIEALTAIQSDILETRPSQIDEFGNFDQLRKLYPVETRKVFFDALKKIHPKTRAICVLSDKEVASGDPSAKTIRLDPAKHKFYGDISIYKDKVAISTLRGKQIAVLIRSSDVADMFRSLFDAFFEKK